MDFEKYLYSCMSCTTDLAFRIEGFALVASGPAIRAARASTSAPMTLAAKPAPKKLPICDLLAALDLEMAIGPRSKSSSADVEDIF